MRIVEGGRKMCEVLETCLTSFFKNYCIEIRTIVKKIMNFYLHSFI